MPPICSRKVECPTQVATIVSAVARAGNVGVARGNADGGASGRRSRWRRSLSDHLTKSPKPCGVVPGHGFLNPFPGTWWARSCVS
jgi:hypothetical protein